MRDLFPKLPLSEIAASNAASFRLGHEMTLSTMVATFRFFKREISLAPGIK
jgi:hypothetical protein